MRVAVAASATSTSKGRGCSISTRCTVPVPMRSVLLGLSSRQPRIDALHDHGALELSTQGCEPLLLDLRWADVVPVALAH